LLGMIDMDDLSVAFDYLKPPNNKKSREMSDYVSHPPPCLNG